MGDDQFEQLPEELYKFIFRHLDHESLKEASRVSKIWSRATKRRMIETTTFLWEHKRQRMVVPMRMYESMQTVMSKDLMIVGNFKLWSENLKEIVLEVKAECVDNVTNCMRLYQFPNLTSLFLVSQERTQPLDNLEFPKSLVDLHLKNFKLESDQPENTAFVTYLSRTKNLKDLSFFECDGLEKLFKTGSFPKTSLKLKTLRLPFYDNFSIAHHNFYQFLLSQSKSLEELFMHKVSNRFINDIIKNFKLKCFRFMKITDDILNLQVQTCESLMYLQLPFPSPEGLQPYLNLAPNLEILHIQTLTDDIVRRVKEHYRNLDEIARRVNEHYRKKHLEIYYEDNDLDNEMENENITFVEQATGDFEVVDEQTELKIEWD